MDHKLAPIPKYYAGKETKNSTKVLLLLKDDQQSYLTPTQRNSLLNEVEKQYKARKKQIERENQPKVSIQDVASMPIEEVIKGIKEGRIVV
jgi:S-adenosylmethionine:diacylglycerol 3-amino-3-carboxypropyl transferase